MGEEKPRIRWRTIALAALWTLVFIFIAWARSRLLDAISGECMRLPRPTVVFLRVPTYLWVAFGVLGGGAIVAKSAMMSPKWARLVDGIALASAIVLLAIAVLALVVLLVRFRDEPREQRWNRAFSFRALP